MIHVVSSENFQSFLRTVKTEHVTLVSASKYNLVGRFDYLGGKQPEQVFIPPQKCNVCPLLHDC